MFITTLLVLLVLLWFRYRSTGEKVPLRQMAKLMGIGMLSLFAAVALGRLTDLPINLITAPDSIFRIILHALISTALMEEGAKLLLLRRFSWKSPSFQNRFHGMTYAACIALGFAAIENALSLIGEGLSVVPIRALLSSPSHLCDGVIMGYFYSRAKQCDCAGDQKGCRRNLWLSFLCPVAEHGLYDASASIGTTYSVIFYLAFVPTVFLFSLWLLRREAVSASAESAQIRAGTPGISINEYGNNHG